MEPIAILKAAHEAADELDNWDPHASPVLGGVSPGGCVRYWVHLGAGVNVDTCPVCNEGAMHGQDQDGSGRVAGEAGS